MPSYRSLTIKMISENTKLLTPIQIMAILQISRPTLYRLMGRRLIPFCKIGGNIRFCLSDINEYIKENSIKSLSNNL